MVEISMEPADILAAYEEGGGKVPFEFEYLPGTIETEIRVAVWELKTFLKTVIAFAANSPGDDSRFQFSVKKNGASMRLWCYSPHSSEPFSICIQASVKGKAQTAMLDADLLAPFVLLAEEENQELLIQIRAGRRGTSPVIDFQSGENYRMILMCIRPPDPYARIAELEAQVRKLKKILSE